MSGTAAPGPDGRPRALVLATRLAGTDGVSLESLKVMGALERLGYDTFACAGEVDRPGRLALPAMHFRDPVALELGLRAFDGDERDPALDTALQERAGELLAALERVVAEVRPSLLVVQNAWAIPMQLPLGLALARLAQRTGLPTLSHEHDYWWERERFRRHRIAWLLDAAFPYHGPNVAHLAINSAAATELARRRGVPARVLPNVMDFDAPRPEPDAYAADFRAAIGLSDGDRMLLQPTRVVPRKGIELAIELVARLRSRDRTALVITHASGDEGPAYLERLRTLARERRVRLLHVADRVGDERGTDALGRKRFALHDAYPHADLVTFPSLYEGFGNALLEAVRFRRAALVNRYPVYVSDLAPTGFRFVEIDGAVTDEAVAAVEALLERPAARDAMADHNLEVARRHFGFGTLDRILRAALGDLGLPPRGGAP